MTNSHFYVGYVMHRRLRPRIHQLRYRIFSLLLDLEEIDQSDRSLRFFSRNRFNLLSFHDRDHGDGSAVPLRQWALALLRKAGMRDIGKIRLLAMPRMLGFVFNPLSVYFCEDRVGELAALIYEVHNTFGERHSYVLPVDREQGRLIRQDATKKFHVSPFLPMDLAYAFRVKPPSDLLEIAITASDQNGPLLTAVHLAERRKFNDREILSVAASHPWMTLKVVAAILFEAAKLVNKGIKIHPHPAPPDRSATIGQSKCEHVQSRAA